MVVVPTRIASLRQPPIAFAHRGASAHARENTLEAFALGLRLGATGLETDAWCTADGVAVLDHDGLIRRFGRRQPISRYRVDELPSHIPTLAQLYETCGGDYELSVDVKDSAAAHAIAGVAAEQEQRLGIPLQSRLWLCTPDLELARAWRQELPEVKIVHSTRIGRHGSMIERHCADLADAGVHVLNMHHTDWSGGLTTLAHRFELLAFGWDAQVPRILDNLLDSGIDAVYSDHVDRMVDALAALT
jgi:glycerophosphoryl diester phosphodiesterase